MTVEYVGCANAKFAWSATGSHGDGSFAIPVSNKRVTFHLQMRIEDAVADWEDKPKSCHQLGSQRRIPLS